MKPTKAMISMFAATVVAGAAPAMAGPLDIIMRGDGLLDHTSSEMVEPRGVAFARNLHSAYQEVSGGMTLGVRELFNQKARTAGRGVGVPPETPFNFEVFRENPENTEQFILGREELHDAFWRGGRELSPQAAAEAQANFDCWVAYSALAAEGATGRADDAHLCYVAYLDALDRIEGDYKLTEVMFVERAKAAMEPAAEPAAYLVFFEFDSTEYTPTGQAALEQAIQDALANRDVAVGLIGHADLSGPAGYNLRLSERRAQRVREDMIAAGVSPARLSTTWVGETNPLVPTADGVREQGNRVVEINLM